METRNPIFVKPALAEKFERSRKRYRILFFSTPCGCGKTDTVWALVQGHSVEWRSVREDDVLTRPLGKSKSLVIDDLQILEEECQYLKLVQLLQNYPGKVFILLSRGRVPWCLLPFQAAGLLDTVTMSDLLLDRESAIKVLTVSGEKISTEEMNAI